MKVKCLKYYFDLDQDRYIDVGEELNVKADRADVLIKAGVVEQVATPTTTKKVVKKRQVKSEVK